MSFFIATTKYVGDALVYRSGCDKTHEHDDAKQRAWRFRVTSYCDHGPSAHVHAKELIVS
jgi:hypothetical protein